MIDLVSPLKFTDKHSSIPTNHLKGNIGGYQQAQMDFIVHWEAIEADLTFYGNQIILNFGSWFDYGFKLNDTIELIISPTSPTSTGANALGSLQISGLTADTMTVANVGSSSGSPVAFTTEIGISEYAIHGTTPITCIEYYFGIIKNSSANAYVSLIDGETEKRRANGVLASNLSTVLLPVATHNKSWVTGTTTEQAASYVDELGVGTSGVSYGYEQFFRLTHTFHVSPAILLGWEDSNGDLDQNLIDFLNATESLKYVPKIVGGFNFASNDHNTDNGNISSFINDGDIGFYDEFGNGGSPVDFDISNLIYTDSGSNAVTSIIANGATIINFDIGDINSNISSSSKFDLYVYELPDSTTDYSNLTTDAWTNFAVSNVTLIPAAGAVAHNKISGATTTGVGAQTSVTFTYTDTSAVGKRHLIIVECCNPNDDDVATSNKVMLKVDYQPSIFHLYLPDNVILEYPVINDHPSNSSSETYTDVNGWVEDDVLAKWNIDLLELVGTSSDWDLTLRSVTPQIIATDGANEFVLESETLTTGTSTTRGFNLEPGDPKNYKIFSYIGSAMIGRQSYQLQYGTKMRYEQWLQQTNAYISAFPTATKNWSIYDDVSGWSLVWRFTLNCTATRGSESESTTINVNVPITELSTYEEYRNCEITGEVSTYYEPTGTDLGGSLAKTQNTIVKARFFGKELFPCIYSNNDCAFTEIRSGSGSFSNDDTGLDGCPEYYGRIMLDKGQYGGGEFTIDQSSTEIDRATLSAFTQTRTTLVAYPYATVPYIELTNEIDVNSLDQSIPSYKLSARLGRKFETICTASIMERLVGSPTEYTNPAIDGFSASEILVFISTGLEQSLVNVVNVVGDTINFSKPINGFIKVCCSVDRQDSTADGDSEDFPFLVGLSEDDFIMFDADLNGQEITTSTGFSFTPGTGTVNYPFGTVGNVMFSFHQTLVRSSLSGSTSFTDPLINGQTVQSLMIFVNGKERTVMNQATVTGDTINFVSPMTGEMKVILVNQ